MCFPTPGRCIRLVCCPSQHDWCLIKGTAGADIHRTLIREARIFFLIYNLCKHLASSPISKTSLSSTTSSTSSTSPDFAQPCISYNLYNLYNLCAILHLLSALLALHLLHRKIHRCAPHKKSIHITLVDLIARWSNMKLCVQTGNFRCLPEQSCWLLSKFYRKSNTDLMIWWYAYLRILTLCDLSMAITQFPITLMLRCRHCHSSMISDHFSLPIISESILITGGFSAPITYKWIILTRSSCSALWPSGRVLWLPLVCWLE